MQQDKTIVVRVYPAGDKTEKEHGSTPPTPERFEASRVEIEVYGHVLEIFCRETARAACITVTSPTSEQSFVVRKRGAHG